MVLASLNKIIGPGVGEEVHPLLGVPGICSEVLDEVVIYKVRSIRFKMIVINISGIIWT